MSAILLILILLLLFGGIGFRTDGIRGGTISLSTVLFIVLIVWLLRGI